MELMTSRDFPFQAIGLVHIENRIEQRAPAEGRRDRDGARCAPTDLRDHPQGAASSTWSPRSGDAWRSWSTYLKREGGGVLRRTRGRAEPPAAERDLERAGRHRPPYASVSGDINPIHMHSLSAKLFGMPGAIAHGMWLKARCLAALENLPHGPHSVEVSFKTPVVLPAKVGLQR